MSNAKFPQLSPQDRANRIHELRVQYYRNEIDRAGKWLRKSKIGRWFSLFSFQGGYDDEISALHARSYSERQLNKLLAQGPEQISKPKPPDPPPARKGE